MFTKMIEIASYFTQTDERHIQRKEIMEDQRLNLTFKEERNALSLFPSNHGTRYGTPSSQDLEK